MSEGWQITHIERSPRNGGLYVRGINHDATHPMDRAFGWHVMSVRESRYWVADPNAAYAADCDTVAYLDKYGWPRVQPC